MGKLVYHTRKVKGSSPLTPIPLNTSGLQKKWTHILGLPCVQKCPFVSSLCLVFCPAEGFPHSLTAPAATSPALPTGPAPAPLAAATVHHLSSCSHCAANKKALQGAGLVRVRMECLAVTGDIFLLSSRHCFWAGCWQGQSGCFLGPALLLWQAAPSSAPLSSAPF